jgi:hypothetical protein
MVLDGQLVTDRRRAEDFHRITPRLRTAERGDELRAHSLRGCRPEGFCGMPPYTGSIDQADRGALNSDVPNPPPRPRCPDCLEPINFAELRPNEIRCQACGHRLSVPRRLPSFASPYLIARARSTPSRTEHEDAPPPAGE